MIFKRTVYENRRKPRGLLRPKVRTNYTDILPVSVYLFDYNYYYYLVN